MGNSDATINLAWIYYLGEYVEKDEKKVIELFSHSASLGNSCANTNLEEFDIVPYYLEQNKEIKRLNKDNKRLNKENEELKLIIEELELRPPGIGGKLYMESKERFSKLK